MPRKEAPRREGTPLKCFRGGVWFTSAACWLDGARRELRKGGKADAKEIRTLLDSAARDAKRASKAVAAMRKDASFIAKESSKWSSAVGKAAVVPARVRRGLDEAVGAMIGRLRPMAFKGLTACGGADKSEYDLRSLYGDRSAK